MLIDFEAALDFLCLDWVKLVLHRKGLAEGVLARFSNIYKDGNTVPMINNMQWQWSLVLLWHPHPFPSCTWPSFF